MSDTQVSGQEPSTEFSTDDAAAAFEAINNPAETSEDEALKTKAQALVDGEQLDESPIEDDTPADNLITVEVDGKMVQLTPEQVAESYKSGLRQSDYSRKTAELAQERNDVQDKARQDRDAYAQKLNNYTIQLEGALNEQSQINWQELLDNDPVEYLKQQHLFQGRQAAYQNAQTERQQIEQYQLHERQQAEHAHLADESAKLVAAIPAWKNPEKARSEQNEIKDFLKSQGFTEQDIAGVNDHRHVMLLRDAMRFNKLLKQAPEATKKVNLAPVKVEKSGNTQTNSTNSDFKAALNKLGKTGSTNDATTAFSLLFNKQ